MKSDPMPNDCVQLPENRANRLAELTSCLEHLEESGRLVRVRSVVSAKYELAGIAKQYEGE